MAKVVDSKVESRKVTRYYPFWQITTAGFMLGLLNWGLMTLITLITDSSTIPGDVATILTATIGVIILIRLGVRQPLIIAIASAGSLWGLSKLLEWLSIIEIVTWNVLLYIMAYLLFSWIARYKRVLPVLVFGIVFVILVRIFVLA